LSDVRRGGCQCGNVRYRIEADPVTLIVCHCSECQRQTGSAFGMSLIVPADALVMEGGEPKTFSRLADSGKSVVCAFCKDCGTRIYHAPEAFAATVNIKPGTLDDTSGLEPRAHVWTSSKQPWVPIPDGVRRFERQP
jgi:hypothetical protein